MPSSGPVTSRRIGPAGERELEQLHVIVDGRERQDVEALHVAGIGIGAALEQRLDRRVVLAICRDEERGAAVGILDVGVFAVADELLDLGHLAIGGGGVQAGVDRDVAVGGCLLGVQPRWASRPAPQTRDKY